ncbi:MAG TPA: hypothetical protein VGE29_03585 [Prosthecobacter sp.]
MQRLEAWKIQLIQWLAEVSLLLILRGAAPLRQIASPAKGFKIKEKSLPGGKRELHPLVQCPGNGFLERKLGRKSGKKKKSRKFSHLGDGIRG